MIDSSLISGSKRAISERPQWVLIYGRSEIARYPEDSGDCL